MSAMAKAGRLSSRYLLAKFTAATDAVLNAMADPAKQTANGSLMQVFSEAYNKQLTKIIGITGVAMAPALNPEATSNPTAFEKLVVRLLPRPSSRTLAVGDVVAFNSPLNDKDPNAIMVRRVAGLEGHPMLTTDDSDYVERVPLGHCWVLADNEELQPPEVIDSRAFGYLDMRLIMGRVIYRVRNSKLHGPVANSPQSEAADAAVIEGEVDVDELAAGMPAE